jgi:peptide methionine sulfoxide reductase MsrB
MDEQVVKREGEHQRLTIEPEKWYELTKCGTGIIFIRPEVFEKISMPYFWYPLNADQGIEGTEDVTFTQKVTGVRCAKCGDMEDSHKQNGHEFTDAGLKIYGYSGCIAGHYHNVNLAVLAHYMYAEKSLAPSIDKEAEGNKDSVVDGPAVTLPPAHVSC